MTITSRWNVVARKLGATAVAGALALSLVPATALADESGTTDGDSAIESTENGEMPSGDMGGDMGDMEPSGEMGEGGGDMGDMGDMGGGESSGGGADTMTFDYSGTYSGAIEATGEEVSADGETYEATETDQNAALVQDGGVITLTNVSLVKSGDDTNGDNCNFYGVNSILLAVGEDSTAIISDSSLSATSEGSNGIFATDSATVYATSISISTTSDNSRGLDATYGGTIIASDVTIDTEGSHCASIASDRGGGYISVSDATLSTAGSGSPLLYSTGDIEVNNVIGTATGSQLCGMEGLNTILINNSTLTSTVTTATASDPIANGIIIYQSTSGDAEASTGETATFQVANSTLTSAIESGSMLFFTNTSADVVLYNTVLDFDSDAANLILATGNDCNSWGTAGSNGATVKVTAIEETLSGDVEVDTISSVDYYLTDGTTWTGATVISENETDSTVDEPLSLSIDSTSTWIVTEDCEVSNLTVAEGGQVVDAEGNTVTIVAGGETVVEGTSSITVTVNSTYSTEYDESSEGTLTESLIDRSGFDETFGTETTWTMGDLEVSDETDETDAEATEETEETTEETEEESEYDNPVVEFFYKLAEWVEELYE